MATTIHLPFGDGCMIFHLNRSVSVFNYSQWRLVCSKSTLGFLTSSIMFLGWLFGNIIFGILSDKYGRRKILFFSSCLVCWVAFVSSFVPWYWMYATLRFIIGFGLGKLRDDKYQEGVWSPNVFLIGFWDCYWGPDSQRLASHADVLTGSSRNHSP